MFFYFFNFCLGKNSPLRPIIRISSKTSTGWHHSSPALFWHFLCSVNNQYSTNDLGVLYKHISYTHSHKILTIQQGKPCQAGILCNSCSDQERCQTLRPALLYCQNFINRVHAIHKLFSLERFNAVTQSALFTAHTLYNAE